MRHRFKGSGDEVVADHVIAQSLLPPYTMTDYGPYSFIWTPQSEDMYDSMKKSYIKTRTGEKLLAFKECTHNRQVTNLTSEQVWFNTNASNKQLTSGGQVIGCWGTPPNIGGNVTLIVLNDAMAGIPDVPDGHFERWESCKPTMSSRANLSVFLYELRDIKRMFDVLPSRHLTWGAQKRKLKSWSDVLQYGNRGHLNYNFGWKPFLSDINNVARSMETFEQRLRKFKQNAGRDLHRRATSTLTVSDYVETSAAVPFWTRMRTRNLTVTYSSAFDYIYDIPDYSEDEMWWRAWLDSLGLNVNASTIWAVLPWSFVVDWFVSIDDALDATETDWLQPGLTMYQACYGRKIKGYVQMNARCSYDGTVLPGAIVNVSHYSRRLGLPNFEWSTNPLDADKIRLGGSLLYAHR